MAPITPDMIDVSDHFWDTFGNNETEISARYIVRFCQERGNWDPFTYEEINAFYQGVRRSKADNFTFNRLIPGWITPEDGKYIINPSFIKRCYEKRPLKS